MIRGVFTALITPFKDDLSIDEAALRKIVDKQIDGGVDGLVPMGTTGESPTVSHNENLEVIRIVADQVQQRAEQEGQEARRVSVIAGTGSNSTSEAIDMTLRAKEFGADASLQVAPYYNKPNQEGLYRHFSSIAEETRLPLIVYNIPGRSARNIETSTILRLAEQDYIVAVKEASADIFQIMDVLAGRPPEFSVLSGVDELNFLMMMLGADGFISVLSNVVPSEVAALLQACKENRVEAARSKHFELLPLVQALFLDTNPIPVKYAMSLIGLCKEVYRLPLCETSEGIKERMRVALAHFYPDKF